MLTSLYSLITILKSILSGFSDSICSWRHQRFWLAGILGRLAQKKKIRLNVSDVAKIFSLSRKHVYTSINRVEALEAKLQKVLELLPNYIMVSPKEVDKVILSLALDAHAPLEGIQRVLSHIYDGKISRSIGYISTLLTRAGTFAEEILKNIPLKNIDQGANDEIFDSSNNPVLTGIDVISTYIYLMQDMYDRKGETWELAMETLKDSGLNLKVSISDAGSGLLKGIKSAFPEADIQIDVFHVLRDIGRSVHRFKARILKEVAILYDLEKAVAKSKDPRSAKYKEKKKKLNEYKENVPMMVEDYDNLTILYSWVQELLSFSGYDSKEVTELMKWLLEEMTVIGKRYNWAFELRTELRRFEERLPATILFLDRLFDSFKRTAKYLGLSEEAFRLLYRRSALPKTSDAYMDLTRQALEVIGAERFGAVEKALDRSIANVKRASSMVENVNSRLRPYMDMKKHVSSQFYSLVQLHMNTKKYRRSRIKTRKGHSPVEILTGEPWPEFIDLLEERGFWSRNTAKQIA